MSEHQNLTAAFIEKTYEKESRERGDAAERKQHAYSMMNSGCDIWTIQWWYENSDSATFKAAKRALDFAIATGTRVTFGQIPHFLKESEETLTDDDFVDVD